MHCVSIGSSAHSHFPFLVRQHHQVIPALWSQQADPLSHQLHSPRLSRLSGDFLLELLVACKRLLQACRLLVRQVEDPSIEIEGQRFRENPRVVQVFLVFGDLQVFAVFILVWLSIRIASKNESGEQNVEQVSNTHYQQGRLVVLSVLEYIC